MLPLVISTLRRFITFINVDGPFLPTHFRKDIGRNNIGNVGRGKRVYGFIVANQGKCSKTPPRLSGNNNAFLKEKKNHKSPFIKTNEQNPTSGLHNGKFSKVKEWREAGWQGRAGGRGDGGSADVQLPLQMGTGPLLVFSKCKQACRARRPIISPK